MASPGSPLSTHPPHPQHTASRFPLPRLSLLAHTPNPPQTHHLHAHTHNVPPRRARGGHGSDSDSDSGSGSGDEESASQSPAPLPRGLSGRQDSQSKVKSKKRETRENRETRESHADSTARVRVDEDEEADAGFGFLSGIDLRAQMAAWERLKKGDTAKRASRGGGGGRGARGRGRGGHGRRQDEEGASAGQGEGGGGVNGDGDGDAGAQVPAATAPSPPKRKSAKQRTAAARLVRQRNLAAKRRGVDDVDVLSEDGKRSGGGERTWGGERSGGGERGGGGDVDLEEEIPGHEPPPPPPPPPALERKLKEGSRAKPLPRRASMAMAMAIPTPIPIPDRGRDQERKGEREEKRERQEERQVEAERLRMPLPRRAVVLGDAVLGDVGLGDVVTGDVVEEQADGTLPPSLTRKPLPLPRATSLSSLANSSHLTRGRKLARGGQHGREDASSSGEEAEEGEEMGEEEGEGEGEVPQTLKIGPPRGVRRDERMKNPLPHPTSSLAGVSNASTAQAGVQQGVQMGAQMGIVDKEEGGEGDDRDPMEGASSTPVVLHSLGGTQVPAASQALEEEGSGVPSLSTAFDVNADMEHHLHHDHTNDGGGALLRSSSSPTNQLPNEGTAGAQDCAMNSGIGVDVLGVVGAMDIDGEGYEEFEEFEEFDIDLDALDLAYPDDETPDPALPLTTVDSAGRGGEILNTSAVLSCNADILMAFEHAGEELGDGEGEGEEDLLMALAYPDGGSPSPSADIAALPHSPPGPLPSSSPTAASPSPSPTKRKRKGNGWIKRKRPTGPRLQSARAPPAPVSAAENMSYEEWCRSVMSRVATSRRRCKSGRGRSGQGGADGWDGCDTTNARNGGGDALESTRDLEPKDGAEYETGGDEGGMEDGVEAEGDGAARLEGPRAGEHRESSGALKIRIKIPSDLSLKSLLPPMSPPQPNADGPPISSPPTPVSSVNVPALVSAPAVASTIVSSPSTSPPTEEAADSPHSFATTPTPAPAHAPPPTPIPVPPASPPTPSYAPRLPITAKRLPSACAGPRCMNLLAVELGYGWKMCEACRVQARRYQHVRKYGVSGGEEMGGEVLGKEEEKEERMRGEGSGVEKKSVRFADDNEVFVIEPRAERDDDAAGPEAPRRRISKSNLNGQFTPHLKPLRATRRFQTVEKLLERLDEQLKAFLRARNLWVEWRMLMKGGQWVGPGADSGVDVEAQTESTATLDPSEGEIPSLDEGGKRANGEMHGSQCYAAAQAMDVDSLKPPRVCEDMGMGGEVRHLGEPLLRIPAPLNCSPPQSLDISENSSLSSPISFAPLPGRLLVPAEPEPSPDTVLTGTPSPAIECLNLSHTYTLASAFTFDGAFSVVAPFCNANVKHGLKIAGVCARIWRVKEMVESVIGVKFDARTTGGNGEEMENQGSSLAVCPCGCGQSAVTMKFCWQSTNDDPADPTHVPSAGPPEYPTDISCPKPNENWTPSTTHPSPNDADMHPAPPCDPGLRLLYPDTPQRDTPLKQKPHQRPLGPCPPKRTLNINTRVLRVALSITILDDPSHPYFPGQQVLVNVNTIC